MKFNINDVAALVVREGFGCAIQELLNPDCVEDQELVSLCREAKSTLNKIESMFESRIGKNWQLLCLKYRS